MNEAKAEKILIFRLSSLGDLILASSVLQSLKPDQKVDWVIAKEFALLLKNHPRIEKLIEFDRKSWGFSSWVRLCKTLSAENYSFSYDLHRSLRTQLARMIFAIRSPQTQWKKVKKERLKLFGLYLFKSLWPSSLRPEPWVKKFGLGAMPNMKHLLDSVIQDRVTLGIPKQFYCVMPSAQWKGKCWPTARYVELIQNLSIPAVILGTQQDVASQDLVKELNQRGILHFSTIGMLNLIEVANLLSKANAYIGNDTGLAHLSEAVGTRSYVLFGPTSPEMGFRPWMKESRAIESSLWCRPCSKDGSACFRVTHRYACMDELSAAIALSEVEAVLPSSHAQLKK